MRFLRDNGLTLVLMGVFLFSLGGMAWSGWLDHNAELSSHGAPGLDFIPYFFSSGFQSALFENWESEFLQMSAYVILTAMLFQRGSAESRDPDKPSEEDAPAVPTDDAPGPVKAGGIWSTLYSYSLGIALLALFVLSFVLHWLQSAGAANEEAMLHGQPTQTVFEYLGDARFWFESFQNWQSEFLSTAVLVVLSIVLRFRGSPESKPVSAPHSKTGQ